MREKFLKFLRNLKHVFKDLLKSPYRGFVAARVPRDESEDKPAIKRPQEAAGPTAVVPTNGWGPRLPLSNMMDKGIEIEVVAIDVWSEPKGGCNHRYREIAIPHKHNLSLGLKSGDWHADYLCLNCSHGACSTMKSSYVKHLASCGPVMASEIAEAIKNGTKLT